MRSRRRTAAIPSRALSVVASRCNMLSTDVYDGAGPGVDTWQISGVALCRRASAALVGSVMAKVARRVVRAKSSTARTIFGQGRSAIIRSASAGPAEASSSAQVPTFSEIDCTDGRVRASTTRA